MTEAWLRLEFLVPEGTVDSVSPGLFFHGALGVEVHDRSTFGADALPDGKVRIISFFEPDTDCPDLSSHDITALSWEHYDDISWRESWKAGFKPVMLSDRLIVGPPWETFEAPKNGHKIVIEPGMAFGTGTHETTALCASFIDTLFSTDAPSTFLDIGCGSGILSIGAKFLGAEHVHGIDVDDGAVSIAKENAEINSVDATFSTEWPDAKSEFVVANILSHILIQIRHEIFSRVEEEGTLIVSGVTLDQEEQFLREFLNETSRVVSREVQGEWVAWVIHG